MRENCGIVTRISALILALFTFFIAMGCPLVSATGTTSIAIRKIDDACFDLTGKGQFNSMAVYGNYLYIADRNGSSGTVFVYDISNPEMPVLQTTTDERLNERPNPDVFQVMMIQDGYLYFAVCPGSGAIDTVGGEVRKFDLHDTPEDPKYIATYKTTTPRLGGLAVIDGELIAGSGSSNTVSVWQDDKTENATGETVEVSTIRTVNNQHIRNGIYMPYGNGDVLYCYSMYKQAFYVVPSALNVTDKMYARLTGTKAAAISETTGYAYAVKKDNGGLAIIDLDEGYQGEAFKSITTISPTDLGTTALTNTICYGYVHGNYLIFVGNGATDKLVVFDISQPLSPKLISDNIVLSASHVTAVGDYIYTDLMKAVDGVYHSYLDCFKIKNYNFTILQSQGVTALPYDIEGTAPAGCEVKLSLKSAEMSVAKTFTIPVDASGWKKTLAVDEIYDGSYTVTAELYDSGDKVLTKTSTLSVNLPGYDEPDSRNTLVNESDASSLTILSYPLDYDTNKVTIIGVVPMGDRIGFKEVYCQATDPNGVSLLTETQASMGQFNFTVDLGVTPVDNRDYTIAVTCEGVTTPVTATFRFYGENFRNAALRDVDAATGETMAETLATYNGVLLLDMGEGSDYAGLLNKQTVLDAIADANITQSSAGFDEIREIFSSAVAEQKNVENLIATIDACTTEDDVQNLIGTNATLLGIDLENDEYKDLSDEAKKSICKDIISYEGTLTEEVVRDLYSEESCLLRLINTSDMTVIGNYLLKYKTELGLLQVAIDKYDVLTSNQYISELATIHRTMARIDKADYFASIPDIATLFNNTLATITIPSSQQKDNNDRGKGSSTGGGGFISGATIPIIQDKPVVSQEKFSDLGSVAWAEEAILYLADKGIVAGRTSTTFAPNDSLRREEFVKLLVMSAGVELQEVSDEYSDVDVSAWYAPYVITASRMGIVNGTGDGKFGVGEELTREQMAVMLERFITNQNMEMEKKQTVAFEDEISEYAKESVQRLAEWGIMNGTSENAFQGKEISTRAMGAKVLYELLLLVEGR